MSLLSYLETVAERRDGGNVEGACAVAAGAAGVEHRFTHHRVIHRHGHLAHGARETDEFLHGLALHPHGHQKCRQLRLAGCAVEDHQHGGARLFRRETPSFGDRFEVRQKGHDIVKSLVQFQASTGSFSNENSRVSG